MKNLIGGGDGGVPQTEDSDNTAIYVIGGLIVVGVIAYSGYNQEQKEK